MFERNRWLLDFLKRKKSVRLKTSRMKYSSAVMRLQYGGLEEWKESRQKKEKRVGLIDSMLKHFPPIETILVHTKEDTSLHCQTLLGLFSCRERISLTPSLFCFVSFFVFFHWLFILISRSSILDLLNATSGTATTKWC